MRTRRLVLAAAVVSAAALVGAVATAGPDPQQPAKPGSATPIATTSNPGRPGVGVTWAAGPWGEAALAGHRVLVPSSPAEGPLTDQSGVGVGYRATELGAAIAVLRQPLMVLAAPTRLHAQVDEACLTASARTAGLLGGPRNKTDAWTLPPATLDAAAAADVRLLGVTVDASGDQAQARVFQAVGGQDSGDLLTATDYRLAFGSDQQWRIDSGGSTTIVAAAPTYYTLPAPSEG